MDNFNSKDTNGSEELGENRSSGTLMPDPHQVSSVAMDIAELFDTLKGEGRDALKKKLKDRWAVMDGTSASGGK